MVESRIERYCPQCGEVTHTLVCRNDGFATIVRGGPALGVDPAQREGELLAGRYRLEQLEASGPLGAWYRAVDERTRTMVQLHLLPSGLFADLKLVTRFQRETPLIASLSHPNLVGLLDHGLAPDGTLYLAYEVLLGPTLADVILRDGPLEPQRVATIGLSLLEALDEVHDHGLLHRSLGLHNVVLQRVGPSEVVKVAQAGLAKILADDDAQPFVWPSMMVSAWRTMAPEQARGRGVTGHADLYSVGAILYELLTAKPVFPENAPSDLLVAHSVKIPKPPERDGRMLVGPLVDVIMRCLEKKPWNRPDGIARAHELLEAAYQQPLLSSPISTAEFGAAPAGSASTRPTVIVAAVRSSSPTREEPRPGTRESRATNPYGLPPAPPPRAVPIAYPSREQPRPSEPPSSQNRRATDPNPSGPIRALAATAVSPRTGPESRPATRPDSFSESPHRSHTMDRSPSGLRPGEPNSGQLRLDAVIRPSNDTRSPLPVADPDSDPELIIRGGPSPVVAFLLGLLAAGALGVAGYFLLFGSSGETTAADTDTLLAAAEPDTLALPSPAPDTGPDLVMDTGPEAHADTTPDAVPDTAVAVATADTTDTTGGHLATADTVTADTQAPVADTTAPRDTRAPKDTVAAGPETRPPKPPRPDGPIDPLADLEDPDFVNRPEPVTLRKVLVDSEPAGAKVAVNGQIIGETPIYVEWQEGGAGVDVVVSKVGFQPVRTRLSAGVGRAVKLRLDPAD